MIDHTPGDPAAAGDVDATERSDVVSRRAKSRWVVRVALAAYLAVGIFPYLVSGLLVPPAAVAGLMVTWAVGLVLTIHWAKRRPLVAPLAVVAALAFWFGVVSLGSVLFGWTA